MVSTRRQNEGYVNNIYSTAKNRHKRRNSCERGTTKNPSMDGRGKICNKTDIRRPYECNYEGCFKTFRKLYHLRTHLRVHTGESPYKCVQCGMKFKWRSSLAYHQKKFHLSSLAKSSRCIQDSVVKRSSIEMNFLRPRIAQKCSKVLTRGSFNHVGNCVDDPYLVGVKNINADEGNCAGSSHVAQDHDFHMKEIKDATEKEQPAVVMKKEEELTEEKPLLIGEEENPDSKNSNNPTTLHTAEEKVRILEKDGVFLQDAQELFTPAEQDDLRLVIEEGDKHNEDVWASSLLANWYSSSFNEEPWHFQNRCLELSL